MGREKIEEQGRVMVDVVRAASGSVGLVGIGLLAAAGCTADAGDPEGDVEEAAQEVVAGQTCLNIVRPSGAVEDATLNSGLPGTNYGSSTLLQVGPSTQTLVKFDISGIPAGVTLARSTLNVRTSAGTGAIVNVHQATASWSESTVTHASYGAAFSPAIEGSFASTLAFHAVDVLALTNAWYTGAQPNNGFYLESSGWSAMYSSEEIGSRPLLHACWYSDLDGDGYDSRTDCDDNDPAVNPGAAEVCNDGIDNNCDGQIDEGCTPSGCVAGTFGGSNYLICQGALDQPSAASFCAGAGMGLAFIDTLAENTWVVDTALAAFGYVDFLQTSYWIANIKGSTPIAPWAPGEPSGDGTCIHILRYPASPYGWNDVGCTDWQWGWVCEG